VKRSPEGEWLVRCGDRPEERRADLAAAIRAAVGLEASASIGREPGAWDQWIREHAARIDAEAAREL
jgi:hypothetical protein